MADKKSIKKLSLLKQTSPRNKCYYSNKKITRQFFPVHNATIRLLLHTLENSPEDHNLHLSRPIFPKKTFSTIHEA